MLNTFSKLLKLKPTPKCADCAAREKYTLLNAAVDTLKGDFADETVRQARLAICQQCDYLASGKDSLMRADRCKLCGCFVHLKASYTNASCDINKW
ncbi:MAG: hypothetical protein JSR44_13345 [Spirochaetes bacterium]|nr:hypothetical protein [Spirochaetota bacterium]